MKQKILKGKNPTELEENIEPSTCTPSEENNFEQNNNIEIDIPEELQRELEEKWNENFRKYSETNIPQRNYQTKFHAAMTDQEWALINIIVERKIRELELNGEVTLWDINVAHYATAITVISWKGNLREHKKWKEPSKPGWLVQAETRIAAMRRKLSFIDCIIKCKTEYQFSKQQREIERKLKHWYGNTRMGTLLFRKNELLHDVKVETEKMRRRKVFSERRRINNIFSSNPKAVYRGFRKTAESEISNPPNKEEIENFWGGIWHKEKEHNRSADWLPNLRDNYCKDAKSKKYKITPTIFKNVLGKMKNNSAPGTDLVVPLWIKKISALH